MRMLAPPATVSPSRRPDEIDFGAFDAPGRARYRRTTFRQCVVFGGGVKREHWIVTDSSTPEDATQATEEQRELQDKLDHQDDDADAPGGWQTRHQIPDEN